MAKFIRWNGWDVRDLQSMYSKPGIASGWNDNDGYGEPDGPVYKYAPVEVSIERAGDQTSVKAAESISSMMIAATIELAKYMTHKSVCVIFGRDMYAMCEVVRCMGHKFRGTFIYVEGASRSICREEAFQSNLAKRFMSIFEKADVIYGVDTGYSGSVPGGMLRRNEYLPFRIREKYVCRLISANSDRDEKSIFRDYQSDGYSSFFRRRVEEIEYYYKPVLRCVEIDDSGMPIMRVANKASIERCYHLLTLIQEKCKNILPVAGLLLAKGTDTLHEVVKPDLKQPGIFVSSKIKTSESAITIADDGKVIKAGTKVTLKKESEFYYQCTDKHNQPQYGVVEENCHPLSLSAWVFNIKWPDKTLTNCYHLKDLIFVDEGFKVGDKVKGLIGSPYRVTGPSFIGYVVEVMSGDGIFVSPNENGHSIDPDSFSVDGKWFKKI